MYKFVGKLGECIDFCLDGNYEIPESGKLAIITHVGIASRVIPQSRYITGNMFKVVNFEDKDRAMILANPVTLYVIDAVDGKIEQSSDIQFYIKKMDNELREYLDEAEEPRG